MISTVCHVGLLLFLQENYYNRIMFSKNYPKFYKRLCDF